MKGMEMAQLEYFMRVVQEKGFSKAASRVFRTQPAVSIAIRRLEEEIGLPLLERSQKVPVLTEAGQVVFDYAQRILGLRDEVGQAIRDLQHLKSGRVRVGANESTSLYLLPELILTFRQQYPDVKVEISRQVSSRLPRELLDRTIDFGLMAFEPVDRELEAFPVLTDELVLIMSPKHSLAGRSSVKVKELGGEPFVAHNVNSGSRVKVIETFARQHTPLNITLELATIETIKRFVQKRVGLAFVPRMCVREELTRGVLVSVPVRGLTHTRTLWAAHRRGTPLSPAATAFLNLLRKHTQDAN
ncbi:MAG TPA: LysR substrate-binding domain-containing protein [Pyrinomonadaceae bacterium]|nr:LysR substrate-binding domain-containing protein [Pyrinomonadaceae bacterium]